MDSLILILTLLSFTGFALAKNSPYKEVFAVRPTPRISLILTCSSWIMLLLTLGLSIHFYAGYGVLLWCGFMALSILIVSFLLAVKPLYIKWLVPISVFFIVVLFLN